MQDFGATVRVVLEEIDALTDHAKALPAEAWDAPTRCEGWDVRALLRHTISAMWQQAEAFHRSRLVIGEPPSFVEIGVEPGTELDALAATRGHLVSGLSTVEPGSDPV
ncbi:MAG TPA: maleylpyruvate isomerase N-terminal domain-containing protein, partial [Acidimicrobiia bacterium]|nr:maleylpyruvate isomerase N-terminal domain-containing protein [Acidimicrobiia bacterium]